MRDSKDTHMSSFREHLRNQRLAEAVNDYMFEVFTPWQLELEQTLREGVYDPGIFKCVFMAGGPGSGSRRGEACAGAAGATGFAVPPDPLLAPSSSSRFPEARRSPPSVWARCVPLSLPAIDVMLSMDVVMRRLPRTCSWLLFSTCWVMVCAMRWIQE